MAKDMAKKDWTDADRKKKNLEKEVKQLTTSISNAPISKTQYQEMWVYAFKESV